MRFGPFETWSCSSTWATAGVYAPNAGKTDVNCCSRSNDETVPLQPFVYVCTNRYIGVCLQLGLCMLICIYIYIYTLYLYLYIHR